MIDVAFSLHPEIPCPSEMISGVVNERETAKLAQLNL